MTDANTKTPLTGPQAFDEAIFEARALDAHDGTTERMDKFWVESLEWHNQYLAEKLEEQEAQNEALENQLDAVYSVFRHFDSEFDREAPPAESGSHKILDELLYALWYEIDEEAEDLRQEDAENYAAEAEADDEE